MVATEIILSSFKGCREIALRNVTEEVWLGSFVNSNDKPPSLKKNSPLGLFILCPQSDYSADPTSAFPSEIIRFSPSRI